VLLVLLMESWILLVSNHLSVEALSLTIVESGETMKAAGLKPIDTVVSSTAVLIKSKNPTNLETVDLVAARIKGVIGKLPLLPPKHLLILSQLHKSTSFANTTSNAQNSPQRRRSHPASEHQLSMR
jgi:hypothetical protein